MMRRYLGMTAVVAGAALTLPAAARACAVCGGDPAAPMTAGMNMAILTLLAVTGGVLLSVVTFFAFLIRRARIMDKVTVDQRWLNSMRGGQNA